MEAQLLRLYLQTPLTSYVKKILLLISNSIIQFGKQKFLQSSRVSMDFGSRKTHYSRHYPIKVPLKCTSPPLTSYEQKWCRISDHLLLHCPVVYLLWAKLCRETNVEWITPKSCSKLVMEKFSLFWKGEKAKTLRVSFLLFCGWFGKNRRIFEDNGGEEMKLSQTKSSY